MTALDSNILIYWLERNPEFYDACAGIIKQIRGGKMAACCSITALAEIYYSNGAALEAVKRICRSARNPGGQTVAELAGKIRYDYGIRAMDALHLASAVHGGADTFITNDKKLSKLKLKGLKIALLDIT